MSTFYGETRWIAFTADGTCHAIGHYSLVRVGGSGFGNIIMTLQEPVKGSHVSKPCLISLA